MSQDKISVESLDYGRVLTFSRPESGNTIDGVFLRELDEALDAIERDANAPIVILRGREGVFCTGRDLTLPADGSGPEELFARYMATLRRLSTMPRVVIACVAGEVSAGGVGLAAASDLLLATPDSLFSLPEILWGLLPACVTPFLIRRVGFQHAYRMALTTHPVGATRAFEMGLVDAVVEQPERLVRQWARRLARVDSSSIHALKRFYRAMWIMDDDTDAAAVAEIRRLDARPETRARIREFIDQGLLARTRKRAARVSASAPPRANDRGEGARRGQEPSPVRLLRKDGIATVVMEDRQSRNTFTAGFTSGLRRAFGDISADPTLKVVVIHGHENYFCCGGTRDELLKIHGGEMVFTDLGLHDLLLRCELPVIAAMQGHALGGGLAMAAYADILIMGRQCLYSANFMQYGFTPGFGSTYIIPRRFGDVLGREMLFTARRYSGAELKERGVGALVVDKREVVPRAMETAREMADGSRVALLNLKRRFVAAIQPQLDECIEKELEMHEATIRRPEVRRRIEALLGDE